eukprot:PhM_4_TR3299/c0_g1_i1/m.33130
MDNFISYLTSLCQQQQQQQQINHLYTPIFAALGQPKTGRSTTVKCALENYKKESASSSSSSPSFDFLEWKCTPMNCAQMESISFSPTKRSGTFVFLFDQVEDLPDLLESGDEVQRFRKMCKKLHSTAKIVLLFVASHVHQVEWCVPGVVVMSLPLIPITTENAITGHHLPVGIARVANAIQPEEERIKFIDSMMRSSKCDEDNTLLYPFIQQQQETGSSVEESISFLSHNQQHVVRRCKELISFLATSGKRLNPLAHIVSGILLHGPSGSGKTVLVRYLRSHFQKENQKHINFLWISCPLLFSAYLGESEQNVRTMFSLARSRAPCVLVLDEVDAIARKRGNGGCDSSSDVSVRVLSQVLCEMDGFTSHNNTRNHVIVLAMTNQDLSFLDPAMLRSGRLEVVLEME